MKLAPSLSDFQGDSMTKGFLVFSQRGLTAYIERYRFDAFVLPADDQSDDVDLIHVVRGKDILFFHRLDQTTEQLVFIAVDILREIAETNPAALGRALERMDRVARGVSQSTLSVSIPRQWTKYTHDNLFTYFALPRGLDVGTSYRPIVEVLPGGGTCFWRLTSKDNEMLLAEFARTHPPTSLVEQAKGSWTRSYADALLGMPPLPDGYSALQDSFDLGAVGFQSVTRSMNYSQWIPRLTAEQSEVVRASSDKAVKVRGQAGTGKTLVLELALLRRLYEAVDAGESLRILFVTHSYAMEEQISSSLDVLDERVLWRKYVDVYPLTYVQEVVREGSQEGVEMLGEDSLDGKKKQLGLISEAINAVVESTWSTYEGLVDEFIARGAVATQNSPDRTVLSWLLMREFAEVIDANRLKPGLNSLRRYIDLKREAWMPPLTKKESREFAFNVYKHYVGRLVEEGQLTTDQVVDDFRAYLETYVWNIRRTTDGYDMIFVDEFHLFNDTERYVFHLLTKDPDVFPPLVMASDPLQSPFALLTNLDTQELSRLASAELGHLGQSDVSSVELSIVHRFTRPIFEFVQYVYSSVPALVELGQDWRYSFTPEPSSANADQALLPQVRFVNPVAAAAEAIQMARIFMSQCGHGERVAVLGVGHQDLDALIGTVGTQNREFTVIEGRDEVYRLDYTRKTVVVTSAEFAAGLQFSRIVVCYAGSSWGEEDSASASRLAISQLYLAATRAVAHLACVCSTDESTISAVLRGAIQKGVAYEGTSASSHST
jgi:hypothetical protein